MKNNTKSIEFWFDFLSPFSYLGSVLIERLAEKYDCDVIWRPTLLGVSVMSVMKLPPLPATPLKGPYSAIECARSYRYFGIRMNSFGDGTLPPLPAARIFTWLNMSDPALAKRFAQAVYRAHWSEATDVTTPDAIAAFAKDRFELDPDSVLAAFNDTKVKNALKASVAEAIEKGVFGVPTFVVDGQYFWGTERLPMVERLLTTGSLEPSEQVG